MGIDCTDVHQIVHLPPDSVESYIQETGRAGRDGANSVAALYLIKGESKYLNTNMKAYVTNKSACRRKMLFSDYEGHLFNAASLCMCCDICADHCNCGIDKIWIVF